MTPCVDRARADPGRVAELLDNLAAVSSTPGPGITRLAYSRDERRAHELVASWWRSLGASVVVDAAGNTIGELGGTSQRAGALGIGSHLDTVVAGGAYDGAAGVVAATEALRLLRSRRLRHPLRAVAFAGEEAARFGRSCLGSSLVAGRLSGAALADLRDAQGTDLAEAMASVDLPPLPVGGFCWPEEEWSAFVELHVEQGSSLEERGTPIGIVELVAGSIRRRFDLAGTATHSGGASMQGRRDALVAAAEVVLHAEELALHAPGGATRITVGELVVEPGGITTVPGRARLLVDARDVDEARLADVDRRLCETAAAICARRGVTLATTLLGETAPATLSPVLRDVLAASARRAGLESTPVNSGAGHDAQVLATMMPTGMVFVPSRGGLSHVAAEHTEPEQIARGVDVCVEALIALDELLGTREAPTSPTRA